MLRRRAPIALAVVIVAVGGACSDSSGPASVPRSSSTSTAPPPRAATDGHLALGELAPLTGPVAAINRSFTTPVQLAVDEMNLDGGVNGQPVTLTVADDASGVAAGRAALAKLTEQDHVDAVVGPSSSEVAADLIPRLADEHVVMCSGSNTAGALTQLNTDGYYFRTAPPDPLQARALARLVAAKGLHRPAVITEGDEHGAAFGTALVAELRSLGLRPVRVPVATAKDATRLGALFTRKSPDSVVLSGFTDSVAPVLKALIAAGHGPQQIPTFASDGLQSADLGAAVDPAHPEVVAGLSGTTPAGAPAGIDHPFNARMVAAGVEPFFSAGAYDCAILIGLAATAARSDDADRIQTRFTSMLTGKTQCTGFHDCAALLARHRRIDYQGAFSAYDHWSGNEPGSGTYDVWTMGIDARPTIGPAANQIRVS